MTYAYHFYDKNICLLFSGTNKVADFFSLLLIYIRDILAGSDYHYLPKYVELSGS